MFMLFMKSGLFVVFNDKLRFFAISPAGIILASLHPESVVVTDTLTDGLLGVTLY